MPTQPYGTFSSSNIDARIAQLYPDPAQAAQVRAALQSAKAKDARARQAAFFSGSSGRGYFSTDIARNPNYQATLYRYGLVQESKNAGLIKTGFAAGMTLIGGAAGGALFGATYGAMIGAAAGGLFANWALSQDKPAQLMGGGMGDWEMPEFEMPEFSMAPIEGQRIDSLQLSDSAYGRPIPLVYGRMRCGGNLIWSDGLIEEKESKDAGGVWIDEYTYYGTFAMAFCQGEVHDIRKIWFDGKLAYDLGADYNGNLLTDGDLEDWASSSNLTSWTETTGGSSTVAKESTTIDPQRSGALYSAKLTTDSTPTKVSIKQSQTLEADTQYLFRVRLYSTTDGAVVKCKVGSAGTFNVTLQASRWRTWLYPFTGTAASWEFEISSETTASCSVYVDSVCVSETSSEIEADTAQTVWFYRGDDTQAANSVITSGHDWGSAWVPAYRGLCYVVFERLPLKSFGNRLPRVEAEIDQGDTRVSDIVTDLCERSGIDSADIDASALSGVVCQGFFINSESAFGSAIEQLRRAYMFDVVETEGVVTFLDTSALSSSATLSADELAVRAVGSDVGPSVAVARAPEHDLPRQVTVVYLDIDREYEEGTQISRRTCATTEQDLTYRLPIAMTADEARQLADKLLYRQWIERATYRWAMSGARLALEPGDVVTLPHAGATETVRVMSVSQPAYGILECGGVQYSAHVMTSASVGASGDFGHREVAGAVSSYAPPPFTPANLSDLELWYKADAITTLADGDPVAAWADSSGNGHDLSQSTAGYKPTYQTGELNGLPVVRFDGSDDALARTASLTVSPAGEYTFAAVVIPTSAINTQRSILDVDDTTYRVGFFHTINSSGKAGYVEAANWNDLGMAKLGAQLLMYVLDTDGAQLYRDGVLVSGAGSYPSTGFTSALIGLGCNSTGSGQYFPGDIAEVCLYSRALSDTERRYLATHLAQKWGLTLIE